MEKKTIGTFIAALRKANGLTQRQLAEKLNVSDKAVSRWERDEAMPDLSLIPVLAKIFGVTADELLRGKQKSEGRVNPMSEKQRRRMLTALQSKYRVRSAIKKLRNTTLMVTAIVLLITVICHAAVVSIPTEVFADAFVGNHTFTDWESFRTFMETDESATPEIVPPGQSQTVIRPMIPEYNIDTIDPYRPSIETIKAADGTILCSFRPLNESVSTIVYSETADRLPVIVYTSDQYYAASIIEENLNTGFIALYIAELIAAGIFYHIRKRKLL